MSVPNDIEVETSEVQYPRERWVEPVVEDYPAFYAAHPETRLTMADIEGLRAEIHRRVRKLAPYSSAEEHADLEADLTLRVLEAATGSRRRDELTGEPVYDYMAQEPVYIVLHASGKVSSNLRRHWKEIESTVPLEAIAPHTEDDDPDDLVDVVDRTPFLPLARLEHSELSEAIATRLSPAQLRIFRLLDAGYERPEIAELLKLDRRTIHSHMAAIRVATEEILTGWSDSLASAALQRQSAAPLNS